MFVLSPLMKAETIDGEIGHRNTPAMAVSPYADLVLKYDVPIYGSE